jgi:putative membrane protein
VNVGFADDHAPTQGDTVMRKLFAATAVAIAVVIVHAGTAPGQTALPAPDQQFVIEAARGGIAEVEMGRLAAQRAASDAVRQFAQRMVTDHGTANQELMQLAQRRGITLPQEMGPSHRAAMDRLSAMSGAGFDQAYMTEMMKDHQQDVTAFTREAREGQDAEVRAWAGKTLAVVQDHQRLAYDVHSRIAQAPAGQPAAVVAPAPVVVAPAPAASPATVTTITTTVTPVVPFCGGAYLPGVGTNFAACTR